MWNYIKNTAQSLYNKVKPTLDSITATVIEGWGLTKDVYHILVHTLGLSKSTLQFIEQTTKAVFKGIKGLTWDLGNEIIGAEKILSAPNSASAQISLSAAQALSNQTKKDLSEAIAHFGKVYQHSGEILSHGGNTLYYTGNALYHTATTAAYASLTAYNAACLAVEGVVYGTQSTISGAKSASLAVSNMNLSFLPSFNKSRSAAPLLMIQVPSLKLNEEMVQLKPNLLKISAASVA